MTVTMAHNKRFLNYKYNGKELQETGMYDYGARMYMPDIGRWGVVDPLSEKYPNFSPYTYCLDDPIMLTDPTGMIVEEGSQKEWNRQKENITNERNNLQRSIERKTARAEKKGWSADKLASKIGDKKERASSLKNTLDNLGNLETSTQVYALKSGAGEEGGTTYDASSGNVVISFDGTANFVHETTHAGQFESGDIGFNNATGNSVGQDVGDEISAYKSQFAYKPSSVSRLNSNASPQSFGEITMSWLQNITKSDNTKPYSQGGAANTGITPVNMNTNRTGLIEAYPGLSSVLLQQPSTYSLGTDTSIYKK